MASSPYPRHPYEIRRRPPNPKSAALLVIDVQKHFSSVALPILPALNATIDLCRAASVPVILTRHCHTSPSDSTMLAEWWGASDLILEGTPASEFLPGLARHDGDRVFEKDTYSAFRGTGLEEALREMGVEEVIVTGVMTNLCCETSAREAFVRGFRVFFSTDATGSSNRDLHDSTIKNMAYGFAYLVDCARLKAAFSPDTMTSSLPVYPYEVHKRDPNPKISALLVIDMQNHFSSVALPILSALNTTIKLCRAASIPIIFTRHRHKSFSDYAMLGEWWGHADLILDGTPASELLPGLARCDGDLIIEKYTYSAFHGTGLEEALKRMGVEEVIVTGVMTNLCCETSAREAFVSGFRVFFSTDATGTANRDLQESTVKNMAYGFAYLMDCGRLKVAFSGEINTRPVAPMISIEEKAVGTSNGIAIGMEFDTFEEAYTYCQTFAHKSGFEYTLRNTHYETTGDKHVCRAKLGCSRAGIAPVKPTDPFYNRRLSSKTNCHAFVRIRLCGGAKYVIVAMTNEHNHALLDEGMMKYLQTKKNSSVGKKKRSKKHE